jgi:hypothetical protein
MAKIKWLYKNDPPEYDAVGITRGGCECDVVHNYKNKWSIYVDNKYIGECDTKEQGKKSCEDFVKKF